TEYNLHTHPFSVEGRRIIAFRGTLKLGLFKNDMNARLASLLCCFASYCGIGIKTALGMGGTEVQVAEYKDKE
ncbi:MAG: CRISPR system precrRNA processing endoribonuclease RAMP protein Cas6, partial [Treponema sp.]|nr:CRISPR system precrRNA processing endoribonuclease RAMP protein Cas6 [Treponema sp.]